MHLYIKIKENTAKYSRIKDKIYAQTNIYSQIEISEDSTHRGVLLTTVFDYFSIELDGFYTIWTYFCLFSM